MKLIKQAILSFRKGRSDKIYEVDLCQVGEDQYVVNFRYGRRGGNLREGSRTPLPVKRADADREFDKLVASKIKKGYRDQGVGSSGSSAEHAGGGGPSSGPGHGSTVRDGHAPDAREHAILDRLRAGERGRWPLDRAIWRAGELGIAAAEPLLIDLWRRTSPGKTMRRYCLVWALGRCGSDPAIFLLGEIHDSDDIPDHTRRIALEGLRRLIGKGDREELQVLIDAHIDRLPGKLADLARTGPAEELAAELARMLDRNDRAGFRALETCYLIDNEHVRPALLHVLRTAPAGEKNYFLRMRHLFKAAEFRRDGQMFGVLAYRFEKAPGHPAPRYYRRRNPEQPFYEDTRIYLRKRTWRTLRRLGRDRSPDFVPMAVGVLLPFSDDDAGQPTERRYHRWRRPTITVRWGPFARYWAFNHLLHGSSSRYEPDQSGRAWRYRGSHGPRDPSPAAREESFPELWEQTPQGLLHLLDESRCQPVHEFAVKALRSCTGFLADVDSSVPIMLLGSAYTVSAELGWELALRIYDPLDPDIPLVAAALECTLAVARHTARLWVDENRSKLIEDTGFLAALATSKYSDNRAHARNILRVAFLNDTAASALIGQLVANIRQLGEDDDGRIADIADTLLKCFGDRLRGVGLPIIRDLMNHPAPAAQELAGNLLMGHAEHAGNVPDDILAAFIGSPHASVRAVGAGLLARLSDAALLERRELLVLLSTHELADLRSNIRPVIARLAATSATFTEAMARELAGQLMVKQAKGVHTHLLSLLKSELAAALDRLGKDMVWKLLHHKHPHAQELGGMLLARNLGPDDLSVTEIVKLASHEIRAIRQGAWAMCEKAIDRLERAMPAAIRLLDARWDDSRQFAIQLFRDRFTRAELTPEILVAICDSIRPDVQAFGRELITRYFRDEDGQTYLLKLSEHPGEALQLFATNYLERYAAGHPDRIRELEPYFLSVLSRVNKGGIAKRRCIEFLRDQALADPAIAEIVAGIFGRQSVTMLVTDKGAMIKAMVDIARAYPSHPSIDVPVHIKDIQVRGARGDAEVSDGV